MNEITRYRTVFISDLHIGSRGCNYKKILSFLKSFEADKLVLVGDIIDFWALKRKIFWPKGHNDIIHKIFKLSKKGTEVIYIPGNHDEAIRHHIGLTLGSNIQIYDQHVHITSEGIKVLCLHGDEFDIIMKNHKVLTFFGDIGYAFIQRINPIVSYFRKLLGFKTNWSLSGFLKKKVKERISLMNRFEQSIRDYSISKGCYSAIAGHTHIPEVIKMEDDFTYYNSGDWVDSYTAIVEDMDGKLKLIKWEK